MRSFFIRTCLIAVALSSTVPCLAANQSSCTGATFSEARSLENLPPEVNHLLGTDRAGLEGIADREGKFNKTDAVTEILPMRRFSLGAVSSRCVLVAVERGGIGYSVELWAFERNGSEWQGQKKGAVWAPPESLQDLVAKANK